MRRLPGIVLALILVAASSRPAAASTVILPTFDDFGELSGATFAGTGIPNEWVAITQFTIGSDVITLGISATQRYENPVVTNDGAGTYFALPGANNGEYPTGGSELLGSTWNFNFYVDISGGGTFDDYGFQLFYDFDPGVGTALSDHGVLDFNAIAAFLPSDTHIEGSENLLFGYLGSADIFGFVTPPSGSFNPFASGQYTFSLRAYTLAGEQLGEAAMAVNVGTVPEPGTLALLGLGLLGGVHRLRRRRQNS